MSRPCCPDCSPYCQTLGLTLGESRGREQNWWAEPFDEGMNTQAVILWGDECCPDCAVCPTCHGG